MYEESRLSDLIISDEEAELFAFNIYRHIEKYLQQDRGEFTIWRLEQLVKKQYILMTLDGIVVTDELDTYNKLTYREEGKDGCSNICKV